MNKYNVILSVNELITDSQRACREGNSTGTAVAQMTDDWLRDTDNKNLVGAVLLDFTAAFDIIDHSFLIVKLKCYGFNPTAILWLESYLTNRKQTIFFNRSFSDLKLISCGVPQGSCGTPQTIVLLYFY